MKKAVYIITAILAVAFTVFLVLDAIDFISNEYGSFIGPTEAFYWQAIITLLIMGAVSIAYAILSLIQLQKETPRLVMLFSGYAFFSSTNIVFAEKWWVSAIYLIAGLLPALYLLIKYGRLVNTAPMQQWQRYKGALIAAGTLSCMCIALRLYSLVCNMSFYEDFGSDYVASVYYSSAIIVIQYICIAVFSFLTRRRTGMLYRMFFIGSSAIGVLTTSGEIVRIILSAAEADYFSIDPMYIVDIAVSLALVFLILIQAAKTRHDGILPQEPVALPQQQTEMSAV